MDIAFEAVGPTKKLVGVRHMVHDEPDDNFMLRDEFLKGISLLKEYNLTYDLLIFPKHLPVAQIIVSMFPEQKFLGMNCIDFYGLNVRQAFPQSLP